ncbi:MAG: hypothetical protein ACQETR_00920 [Thermodesulfobacteriota bacterium]
MKFSSVKSKIGVSCLCALVACFYTFVSSTTAFGQPVVPSRWEGRVTGEIHGQRFNMPVTIELRQPLPWENNPFHLFVGTTAVEQVGAFGLTSAIEMGTGRTYKVYDGRKVGVYDYTVARSPGRGNVTLQFFSIRQSGNTMSAVLTDAHKKEASAINIFTGPNVSAMEASDLMRGVLQQLGTTEMFTFGQGASIQLEFGHSEVIGVITGMGSSVLGTSPNVRYRCSIRARRVKK